MTDMQNQHHMDKKNVKHEHVVDRNDSKQQNKNTLWTGTTWNRSHVVKSNHRNEHKLDRNYMKHRHQVERITMKSQHEVDGDKHETSQPVHATE